MKISRLTFPTFVTLCVFLSACGKPAPAPVPPAAGHPLQSPRVLKGEPAKRGGRLTLLSTGAPRTFNPVLVEDGASDDVTRLIFCGLVALDGPTQAPRPALAESWAVAPDGCTWTFKLRAGLRWSDGQPLTSKDVSFTWNEVMYNPELNRLTYEVFRIRGTNFTVRATDDLTVQVTTPAPFAPFLEFFGSVAVLPEHVLGSAARERRFLSVYTTASRPDRVVGSGPFRLKDVKPGESVRLERNPEYWAVDEAGTRLPYLDEVLILATSGASPTIFFLNGHGDLCERTRPDEFLVTQKAALPPAVKFHELGPGVERDFVWFNLNTNLNRGGQPLVAPARAAWFQQAKFRQAVSCALDRERLVKAAYAGRAAAVLGLVGPENPKWHQPDLPRFGHDLARARTLLGEIGIQDRDGDGTLEDPTGRAIEFSLCSNTGNPVREQCAQLIVEDLRRLGMKVSYQAVSFPDLVTRINDTFDYECALMGLGGGGMDPASQINVLRSSEPMHQWFPSQRAPATDWEARIDSLMDSLMRTLDFATRKSAFDEVQRILAEQSPMIYTAAPHHFAATRVDLINLRPAVNAAYRLTWNIEQLALLKP